jgi:hypothetical protein
MAMSKIFMPTATRMENRNVESGQNKFMKHCSGAGALVVNFQIC